MAGFIGGRTSAFDYIGPDLPNNPQNGEMWFDTDGASDGSGEVKIYDGANDAWEATGFTSHADLTDVTRSAHHPPVDVSGPLTQPADQSLGLSFGDGLDNVNGTLVAALGNGLGVDANGQVYVPAGALAHGAEVDTPSDAHHSRYADSEARTAVESGVSRVGGSGIFLDFDNSPDWAELVDGGGARYDLVLGDLYVDGLDGGTWLAADGATQSDINSHAGDADAHHDAEYVWGSQPEPISSANVGTEGSHSDTLPAPADTVNVQFNASYASMNNNAESWDFQVELGGETHTESITSDGGSPSATVTLQASQVHLSGTSISGTVTRNYGDSLETSHDWTINLRAEHQRYIPHSHDPNP